MGRFPFCVAMYNGVWPIVLGAFKGLLGSPGEKGIVIYSNLSNIGKIYNKDNDLFSGDPLPIK